MGWNNNKGWIQLAQVLHMQINSRRGEIERERDVR